MAGPADSAVYDVGGPCRAPAAEGRAGAHQGRARVELGAAAVVDQERAVPAVSARTLRIGYLIPEFPGQTHIFFWREMQELARLGIVAELVSTRRPDPSVVCHRWSREAMARTTYLFPPTLGSLAGGIGRILAAGPLAWARAAGVVAAPGVGGPGRRARVGALAVMGGVLGALAKRRGWGHIHVHCCADSAYVALFASIFSGVRYSLTLHGPLPWFGAGQDLKWGNSAFAVAITERLRREAAEALGTSAPGRIEVAPMGVDTERFVAGERAARERGEPWRIVACGRLHTGKGHQDLIRAVALLRSWGVPAELRILGGGDAGPMLEALITELSLQETVRLAGAVDEDIVREELRSADVFALGSHEEALGVATMEAMAMGLPVVVTGVGGVPELVRDGVDGLLVPARDPQAMAAALQRVYADAELASRLGSSGRQRVHESFSSRLSAEVIARRLGVLA